MATLAIKVALRKHQWWRAHAGIALFRAGAWLMSGAGYDVRIGGKPWQKYRLGVEADIQLRDSDR